jgi:uncharacterized membrane protein YesL
MNRVLPIAWFAVRKVYEELFPLVGMGLIWFVAAVALPLGVFSLTTTYVPMLGLVIVATLIALIPAPPATAAIYYVASELAREKRIEFGYFWTALKKYFWQSWKVGAIVLVSGAVLIVDVLFYFSSESTVFAVIGFLGLWALLFWIAIQVHLFPLLVMQEDVRVALVLKNSALLTLAYPFFVLGILIVALLATALSTLLVFVLLATLWMPFVAVLFCRATLSSLDQVQSFREQQEEKDDEDDE